MANLPLATVEGSGNFQPVGTLIQATVPTGTRVFDADGVLYSRDNTPGYAIPNFDTKVPSYLKGIVGAHSYINFQEVYFTSDRMGAGISSDGTIMRICYSWSNATIERKRTTDTQFVTVFTGVPVQSQGASQPAIVETDNNGRWIIAFRGQLFISVNNGDTWEIRSFANGSLIKPIHDVKYGTGGVVLVSCRASSGSTVSYLYRSTDYGYTWTAVPSVGADIVSLCKTTGTNWIGVSVGLATTRQSSDDGLTWSAGPTMSVTLGSDTFGNIRLLYSAGGRFYLKNDSAVHTGTSLTSLTAITGASPVGLGVDASNNAVAINSGGQVFRSANGANFVAMNVRATVCINPFDVKFANGTWVDCEGAYITNTDLLASKSFTSWSLYNSTYSGSGGSVVMADTSDSGVSIIALNYNSYLRSTDGFKTFEIRGFNVNFTSGATYPYVTGVATDDSGNWVVTFFQSAQLFYSSDNGLTWVIKTSPSAGNIGVAGGGGAGRFLLAQSDGAACYYTNDGFNTSSSKTVTGSSQPGCSNPVYCGNGFFAFMGNSGSATSRLLVVNASTGSAVTYTLGNLNGATGNTPMFGYQGSVFLGTLMYSGVSTASPPIEGNRGLGGDYAGIFNGTAVTSGYGFGFSFIQVGTNNIVSLMPSKVSNLWLEGIKNYGYSASTFIKVN